MKLLKRYKQLIIVVILLFGYGGTGIQAQSLLLKENNSSQTAYALSNIQKMIFSSGFLEISKTDNSSASYAIADLRYLSFSDLILSTQQESNYMGELRVYPNPVETDLNIDLPEEGSIQILSLDGKIMLQKKIESSNNIKLTVEQLQKGIYICHYTNGVETRTVKFIKQ